MRKLCGLFFIASIAFVIFGAASAGAEDLAYGAYGHYPVGSGRVLAMGGAFVGLADDASAVVVNPAGLSWGHQRVDLTSGENRVINREATFGAGRTKRGIPYSSVFRAGSVRAGPFGLGVAYSTPYVVNYDRSLDPRESNGLSGIQKLQLETTSVALSMAFGSWFSLGVTGHYETMTMGFQSIQGDEVVSKSSMSYPQAGILFQLDSRAQAGITYTGERRYSVDETLDNRVQTDWATLEWFKDVVVPWKIGLGLSVKIRDRLRGVGDIDIIGPLKNATYVGGRAGYSDDKIIEQQQTIIHGGFEYQVLKQKEMEFTWRGGGYNEPRRLADTSDRLHFTMGIEWRFYFIVLGASYDQAQDFNNFAQWVSLSLGAI